MFQMRYRHDRNIIPTSRSLILRVQVHRQKHIFVNTKPTVQPNCWSNHQEAERRAGQEASTTKRFSQSFQRCPGGEGQGLPRRGNSRCKTTDTCTSEKAWDQPPDSVGEVKENESKWAHRLKNYKILFYLVFIGIPKIICLFVK